MGTWLDFARALLAKLGAPDTHNNQAALLAWMAGEQPPLSPNAAFNPFNIQAHGYPGEGGIVGTTSHGQFEFADWATGVTQTAAFLGQSRYAGVVSSLRGDAPAEATLKAIQTSGWAASGYGGKLPGLLKSVLGRWADYAGGWVKGAVTKDEAEKTLKRFLEGKGSAVLDAVPDPVSDVFEAALKLLEPIFSSLTRLALVSIGVAGGVALLVLGVRQATTPVRKKINEEVAPIAATVATGGAAAPAMAAGAAAKGAS